MNRAIPDAMVSGYEHLIDTITLPDENDRHVVAAAIVAEASVILTANLKDFPPSHLPDGIVALAPDPFLCELFDLHPDEVLETMREHRQTLQKPSKTVEEYLSTLSANGLILLVQAIRGSGGVNQ